MKWSLRDWVYVAIFGALWGAVEITLGSYLHVIFPSLSNTFLNGLVLTFLGVVIALIGRRFVPHTGAVLMIGVVTVLLKLLSWGGVKIGPMVAILAEAALMEVGLLWGARRVSYLLAGLLAFAWNTVHPFIMLPLLFGLSLTEAYAKLVRDGVQALGRDLGSGALILFILFLIRIAVGSMAGWAAWELGRAVGRRRAVIRPASES